ncbi:FtsK/SpoIIIE family DNA translocase [Gellertiella hungarica]|uniref:DNA translocase FtsK n=1 Tax=Gellertiella hungarica TaxID=1572859 RepID=A0A7W6J7D4_9HYPH|nr:DNA translocase FtsK [Gellertiella hungarica]MBB4065297.1 S-DNA-T family DNA segregation ATPase FtsK/SpoIIIE [Gellertiella hungarica]
MSRSYTGASDPRVSRFTLSTFLWRQTQVLLGLSIFGLIALGVAALATWNVSDPSPSYATSNLPTNLMGYTGAAFADVVMQFFGLAGVVAFLPVLSWSLALITGRRIHRMPQRIAAWLVAAIIGAAVMGCFPPPKTWPIPNGIGGVIGDMILRFPALFIGSYPTGMFAMALGGILAIPAAGLLLFASGLIGNGSPVDEDEPVVAMPGKARTVGDELDEDEREGFATFVYGWATHAWYTVQARLRRLFGIAARKPRTARGIDEPYDFNEDEFTTLNGGRSVPKSVPRAASRERLEPTLEPDLERASSPGRRVVAPPPIHGGEDDDLPFDMDLPRPAGILPDDDDEDFAADARMAQRADRRSITPSSRAPVPRAQVQPAAPAFKPGPGRPGVFELPDIRLLAEPRAAVRDHSLNEDALEQNARMLEGVLEDFGVKGEIIHVHPGPVVTLYELEPAPGIKSSRVIGLADDIARSMSAIAARVAVVPGRNAIGIELPNQTRETVFLRELIGSKDFGGSKAKLAMALGKTIGGEPVIADLAKMPHLLVAGTTGSGKSVAINTMILSLLYRMTPEQCRLIMIDPKMLELSVYDGIPHLLSPVVTDPKKAVVALKWTVREMEERYKKMSKIGVRNIDGFNSRVEQAIARGETITRTVQTGFDRETGEAMYETEEFDLQPIPYIVVIIDEMADLMMVAGKDIEGAVQRLAQMARAAGIHVIMATQRPSVDVITGTIKANFPTRISFQVTSKIDSRTILGEQGAEQLLGMGDMLYMAGGGRIQRVHGPFVSDHEVEEIVSYLKTQGAPQYLDAITADDEEDMGGGGSGPAGTGNLGESDDPYDQAVAIVLRDGKASTSYIQRRLGIGYNRAASLIERMEQEGLIGPANHAGKREILVPTEADIIER